MHAAFTSEIDPQLPPIALRHADMQALLAIAYGGLLSDTRSAGALLQEISRAALMADDDSSLTAGLWSRVLFRDERAGTSRWITLVPPHLARAAEGQVSVLSPVGAALIGLSMGQHIRCPDRRGGELSLTALNIFPPDADREGGNELN